MSSPVRNEYQSLAMNVLLSGYVTWLGGDGHGRQLGDPAPLRLLEFLLGAEHTVGECSGASAPQNRASAHLACLADCGYVQPHRAGRFAYYKGGRPRVAARAAYNAEMLANHVRIAPATA